MASHNTHPLPMPPGQPQHFAHAPPQQYQQAYHHQYQQPVQQQQFHQPVQQHFQPPVPPTFQQPVQPLQSVQPAPPIQQKYQQSTPQKSRPKSRTFSFRSDKSQRSAASHNKIDLTETSAEKEAKRLHSKADPSLAMNEAEPAAVQAYGKTSLAPLRGIQHKDAFGNPIADPDRSNPTRSRWERPLDTIRSFEAAIDGGYNQPEPVVNWNRRSSYYGNSGGRFPHDSYYGGRPQSTFRGPQGFQDDPRQAAMQHRDSFYEGQQGRYTSGYVSAPPNPGRQRYHRMTSEPQFNSHRQADPNVYPIPNNHRSYETVASASGSGTSGEHAGYQTDITSSDNSSVERVQVPPKRQPQPTTNDYGFGFSQNSSYQAPTFTVGVKASAMNGSQPNAYQSSGALGYALPPVPQKDGRTMLLRKPTNQTLNVNDQVQQRPGAGEKRKSWFARRFSKQS